MVLAETGCLKCNFKIVIKLHVFKRLLSRHDKALEDWHKKRKLSHTICFIANLTCLRDSLQKGMNFNGLKLGLQKL
jgi:hypothetical protein